MTPECCGKPMHRNGKTAAGHPRLRCSICGASQTISEYTHGGVRHGEPGRTSTDRVRAHRARKKQQGVSDD